MPELPEVETTRRGLAPLITGRSIAAFEVRDARLRWPIDPELGAEIEGRPVASVTRRGKYLLLNLPHGALVVHLGMSGSLRFLAERQDPGAHDHVDVSFAGGGLLRYNDPRRFGSIHFAGDPLGHRLLCGLGPEPLGDEFTEGYLWQRCRGRRTAIKSLIMNASIVVGVGNIYASESLFLAKIHPKRRADRISEARMAVLAGSIKSVLQSAIIAGGTTLRDFHGGDGEPGYFQQQLDVYGRDGEPCRVCDRPISVVVLGQRATFYCSNCQR